MEFIIIIGMIAYPLVMLFWDLHQARNYIEPGHISPKLTPGSDEWMRALLEPGDQQKITTLEHEIDDIPDFDNSIIGRLSEGIYHNKDECQVCNKTESIINKVHNGNGAELYQWDGKEWISHRKQAPRIPTVRERKENLKQIERQRKLMVLPPATFSSEPSEPIPTRHASLTHDQVHLKENGLIKTFGMKPCEVAERWRMDEFFKATEVSEHLLTVNEFPEGVPEGADTSLRHLKADNKYLFIMYKWYVDDKVTVDGQGNRFYHGEPRYHVRHVVINDNQNNRRAIGASTGPR